MNVLMLLTPKSEVKYIKDGDTLRQGLEKMKAHGYAAIPVITKDGLYAGSVSEGDFLRAFTSRAAEADTTGEKTRIREIIRPDFLPAVMADVEMDTLITGAEHQNYIPVTDDRGTFIGIVTRKRIIEYLRHRD